MRYFDSSALVKLVVVEEHSDLLAADFTATAEPWSCGLARVEVARVGALHDLGSEAGRVVERLFLVAISDPLLRSAASLAGLRLRSLDAIHVAAAQALGDELEALVTYDRRMQEAARELGLPVAAPGQGAR